MAQNTLAPWAEPVPNRGPTTVDELVTLPEDGWQYELVEGRLVRMPPPGGEHGELALDLAGALRDWVKPRGLGRVLAAETGFQVGPQTVLAAQVGLQTVLAAAAAFVRTDRVPPRGSADRKKHWQLAPDLVAEVASPSQKRTDVEAKASEWLAAGVRLVWIVWPYAQQVDVWRPGSAQAVQTLGIGAALDGLDVLPGFTYPLADLFA